MSRFKNKNWSVGGEEDVNGEAVRWPDTWQGQQLAVLMDVRDELQKLNNIFGCHNFLEIPRVVKAIRTNTGRIPAQKRTKK